MRRPPWATGPVLVFLAVVAVVAAVVAVVLNTGDGTAPNFKPPPGVASDVAARIPAGGGITLSAEVITPKGPGPFPLVVMPGSWASPATEYHVPGQQFAALGYQVVSYAQRGAKGSGGANDLAGDKTQSDVRTVVDWALAHTAADPARIGMLGISYGAGISLLAAAADSRIKAVVAMSGWAQLAGALAPNGTPNVIALHLLLDGRLASRSLGKPPRQLAASLSDAADATYPVLQSLGESRSAASTLRALDKNQPAIMLASPYQDSIVDPTQLVPFFDHLTTPKRLEMAPGEHGGPELAGLQGAYDQTFVDALLWLDRYVRGAPNGIDRADPIELVDTITKKVHGYRKWPAATTVAMGAPNQAGDQFGSSAVSWSRQLTTGTDSGATSGPSFIAQPTPFHPPTLKIGSVKTDDALAWNGAPVTEPTLISGLPSVRLDVTSSSPRSTFFTYLYDVDPSGDATLVTYAPMTTTNGPATVTLRPASWTVATGHHLALVLDTVDPHYASAAPSGSTLVVSSSPQDPMTLSLPQV